MSSLILSLPELVSAYKNWVSEKPQLSSDCETTAKWISYFIAGRISNSHVLSELVYCLSNLLVFVNDRIINNARHLEIPGAGDVLKLWLTVVEYCEVFFELSAKKLWGNKGKWFIIVALQLFKCISRIILIYKHDECIIQSPAIPPLDRVKLSRKNGPQPVSVAEIAQSQFESASFVLKNSGRVVRKVDGAPPINLRSWKPIQSYNQQRQCENEQTLEQALAGRQLFAETIYIVKPIAHLASLSCFGERSWKPWMLSLALDLTSLQLYNSCKKSKVNSLTPKQRLQLSKRTVILVMYLLRSPFYERHSKDKIEALLRALSKNVPLCRMICNPIAQYLPFWQSVYFYMWSS